MVKYLIDTNILIYHTKGSEISMTFLNRIIDDDVFTVSIITKIEFLGWHKHTIEGYKKCSNLIKLAKVYNIDDNIADKAIELRKDKMIMLADAVIAATAIVNDLTLVTRNTDDFLKIKGLNILNPFKPQN